METGRQPVILYQFNQLKLSARTVQSFLIFYTNYANIFMCTKYLQLNTYKENFLLKLISKNN